MARVDDAARAVGAQLGDGAQLELTHALARDAEALAERTEGDRARRHVARLQDGALARIELLERLVEQRLARVLLLAVAVEIFLRRTVAGEQVRLAALVVH